MYKSRNLKRFYQYYDKINLDTEQFSAELETAITTNALFKQYFYGLVSNTIFMSHGLNGAGGGND